MFGVVNVKGQKSGQNYFNVETTILLEKDYSCRRVKFLMLKKNKILVVFLLLFNVLNAETLNNEMDSIEQMLIRGDFEQSEKRLNIVEQLALDSNNLKLYKRVLSFQLHCYESLFKKNEFLITTDKIYELGIKTKNDTLTLKSFFNKGFYYYHFARDNEKSLENYLIAYDLAVSLKHSMYEVSAEDNIALIYLDFGDYEKSRNIYLKNIKLHPNNNEFVGINYVNIGYSYALEKKHIKAIKYYDLALEHIDDEGLHGQVYLNIGGAYAKLNKFSLAEKYFKKGLETAFTNNEHYWEISAHIDLAELYTSQNQTLLANEHLKKGYKKSVEYGYLKEQIEFLIELIPNLEELGETIEANNYKPILKTLNDSLKSLELDKIVENINLKSNLENNTKTISQLKEKTEKESAEKKFYIGILLISILSLLLLIFFFRKRAKKNKLKAGKKITEATHKIKQQELELVEKEKKLKNNINRLIKKNSILSKNETIKEQSLDKNLKLNNVLTNKILTKEDWIGFKTDFEKVFPNFIFYLKEEFPTLTDSEQRLFMLIKLKLSTEDISNMLGISSDSVRKTKFRLRKSMGLDSNKELNIYILNFKKETFGK